MVIRQLDEQQYDQLYRDLLATAQVQPLDPTYTVTLFWKGGEYSLKLLPEEDNQIIALQALQIQREKDGIDFTLLTDSQRLTPLLDHFLQQ